MVTESALQISNHLFQFDLAAVIANLGKDLELLRGKRLFISGGTGFFGRWILESLVYANEELELGLFVCVLSRNPEQFLKRAPHFSGSPLLEFIQGDVRSFTFPEMQFDYVIHAANDTALAKDADASQILHETIVNGTARMLEFAERCKARGFLLVSSGSVYGVQPPTMLNICEDYECSSGSYDAKDAYRAGKRKAEELCLLKANDPFLKVKIARCFAFIGPLLPLDGRYAAGNFIGNAISGQAINISGDGTPLRSYLYASDLVVWLLKILLQGKSAYPYNVGSQEVVSIRELAEMVALSVNPPVKVVIKRKAVSGGLPDRYVPDTFRARESLGLKQTVGLHDMITRTIEWYSQR